MKRTLICSDSHTPYNRVTSKAYQNLHASALPAQALCLRKTLTATSASSKEYQGLKKKGIRVVANTFAGKFFGFYYYC
jgi:hypothetical protein